MNDGENLNNIQETKNTIQEEKNHESENINLESRIDDLIAINKAQSQQIEYLSERVQNLYTSRVYRFLLIYAKISSKLIPYGSFRRKIIAGFYNKSKAILKLTLFKKDVSICDIFNIGFVSFLKNTFHKKHVFEFGKVFHNPLVSILIVNFNGADHIDALLESIDTQSYTNYELIFIDNNSKDSSLDIIRNYKLKSSKRVKLIINEKNLGFAEANNIASNYAKGEFLALLNVDTKVDSNWLLELVEAIRNDPVVAIAVPKVLFWQRFHDLEISGAGRFSLDLDALRNSLTYKRFFIRRGIISKNEIIVSDPDKIIISIPVQKTNIELRLLSLNKEDNYVDIRTQTKSIGKIRVTNFYLSHRIYFSLEMVESAKFVINNAGAWLGTDSLPKDRGFGQYDNGQYDKSDYVQYFCGCSALIRRAAIIDRTLFISEFFAYYEDSELARWLISNGYKMKYTPRSIVYHKYASSSLDGSELWHYLTNRSLAIFNHIKNTSKLIEDLKNVKERYKRYINSDIIERLSECDQRLRERLLVRNELILTKKVIGVYNRYWNTKDCGESHVLSVASELQEYAQVYLISENDFDIEELSKYFSIDLSNCRKLVVSGINPEFTRKFYLFINSTFMSDFKSFAKFSWYIVSFPSKKVSKGMLDSYYFLFNSDYSRYWAQKYWGKKRVNGDVLYPIRMLKSQLFETRDLDIACKKNIILSVGRFFSSDHCKNHHKIAEAFKQITERDHSFRDWKLVIAGSLDESKTDDVKYFKSIEESLSGLNARVLKNIDKVDLDRIFKEAKIYVHAVGLGCDKEREPEKFEHFGITIIESTLSGCIPLVLNLGGASIVLKNLGIGYFFDSYSTLVSNLARLMQLDLKTLEDLAILAHQKGIEFVESESNKKLPIGNLNFL